MQGKNREKPKKAGLSQDLLLPVEMSSLCVSTPRPLARRLPDTEEAMTEKQGGVGNLARIVHHNLIWFLLGTYGVAAFFPGPGRSIRAASLGELQIFGESTNLSLPLLLLGFLLLNAGMGVHIARLRGLLNQPFALILGIAANLTVPVLVIFAIGLTL
ncbi:MAG TPA: hypothetical protein VGL71_07465, partial [Urbifossiella sp.]